MDVHSYMIIWWDLTCFCSSCIKFCFDCMAHIITLCIITFRQVAGGLPNTAAWIQSGTVWFNKGKVHVGPRQCTFLSYKYQTNSFNISRCGLNRTTGVFSTCLGLLSPHCYVFSNHILSLYLHCFTDCIRVKRQQNNVKLSKAMPGSQPCTPFIHPVTFSNYRAMWLAVTQ